MNLETKETVSSSSIVTFSSSKRFNHYIYFRLGHLRKQTIDDLFLTLHSQERGKSKFEKKNILYNAENA